MPGLPADYRDFLSQWNGAFLFHDDYALHGVAGAHPELARLDDRAAASLEAPLCFGSAPDRTLLFDGRGRVLSRDAETDEVSVEGSTFARWLDATMAREAVLYDRDGEFREEAFTGGEVSAVAARKRAQTGVRADPESPAWRAELAELLVETGQREQAIDELVRAVALWPEGAPLWMRLGRLHREAGAPAEAAAAFARSAEAERDDEEAAFAFASAARAASEAGLATASALGARAAGRLPDFAARQRDAATHLIGEGDLDGAAERLALAAAVAPDDPSVRADQQLLRARARLKTV